MFDYDSLTPQFSALWVYPTPFPIPTTPTASEPCARLSSLLFFTRVLECILCRDSWETWSVGRYR